MLAPVSHSPFRVVFREGLTASIEYRNGDSMEHITILREELPALEAVLHEATLVHLLDSAVAQALQEIKR